VAYQQNEMFGMLNFFPVPVPLPPTFSEIWYGYPDMAVDTCKEVYPSSVSLATNQNAPDAGDVTLEGPSGSMSFTNLMGSGMYVSIMNPPSLFVPVSTYTLRGTGGQIPAFSKQVMSPGEIKNLNPNVASTSPFVIDRSQPFTIKWESVSDGYPIQLYLEQQDQPEYPRMIWFCKVNDDGEFAVPQSVLANFGPTVEPFPTEDWRDKIALSRQRITTMDVQGAVGPVLTGFDSGWYANVRFE